MRRHVVAALALSTAVVTAACGDDSDDAADTTSTTPATTAGPAPDLGRFRSTDPVALNLDKSLTTADEVQAALSFPELVSYPGPGAPPPLPQGPLNIDGLVAIFPSPAYRAALETGKAAAGANRTFLEPQRSLRLNTLAVKFENADRGAEFVQFAVNVATAVGKGEVTDHPEATVGVLPGQVIRVPAPAGASPPTETVVAAALYPNGVYYQVSVVGPVGVVTDDTVIAYLRAQDAKYTKVKGELGL